MTFILSLAHKQAKQPNRNLSAQLLTSRIDQDKLFYLFLLFPFAFIIYIPLHLAELPPLHFWIIT